MPLPQVLTSFQTFPGHPLSLFPPESKPPPSHSSFPWGPVQSTFHGAAKTDQCHSLVNSLPMVGFFFLFFFFQWCLIAKTIKHNLLITTSKSLDLGPAVHFLYRAPPPPNPGQHTSLSLNGWHVPQLRNHTFREAFQTPLLHLAKFYVR